MPDLPDTPAPPPPPTQPAAPHPAVSLDDRLKLAEIRKNEAETERILYDHSPSGRRFERLKVLAGLGGWITGLVAVLTLAGSLYSYLEQSRRANQLRTEERLTQAITSLSNEMSSPAARVGAINTLATDLNEQNAPHATILKSLAGALGFEGSAVVRSAIIDVLEGIDPSKVEQGVLNATLRLLAVSSRGLVQEGLLAEALLKDPLVDSSTFGQPVSPVSGRDPVIVRAHSVARAIQILIRKGARVADLSGIFCFECDFRKVSLPKTSFANAVLIRANFTDATLHDSNFDNALIEGAVFRSADLTRSRFGQPSETSASLSAVPYPVRIVRLAKGRSLPVDFACADLRDASFEGHIVGAIYHDKLDVRWGLIPTLDFSRSDLSGAKFGKVGFLVLHGPDTFDPLSFVEGSYDGYRVDTFPPEHFAPTVEELAARLQKPVGDASVVARHRESLSKNGSLTAAVYDLSRAELVVVHPGDDAPAVGGFTEIADSFDETNWRAASLPPVLTQWLSNFGAVGIIHMVEDQCQVRTGAARSMPDKSASNRLETSK